MLGYVHWRGSNSRVFLILVSFSGMFHRYDLIRIVHCLILFFIFILVFIYLFFFFLLGTF